MKDPERIRSDAEQFIEQDHVLIALVFGSELFAFVEEWAPAGYRMEVFELDELDTPRQPQRSISNFDRAIGVDRDMWAKLQNLYKKIKFEAHEARLHDRRVLFYRSFDKDRRVAVT